MMISIDSIQFVIVEYRRYYTAWPTEQSNITIRRGKRIISRENFIRDFNIDTMGQS